MYVLQPDVLTGSDGKSPIAVASQAVVYTKAHKINYASIFGLNITLASTNGTPSVQVDMQVSDTAPDALEGVADSVGLDWCTQEGGTTILTPADKVLHKITVNPTPSMYVRFKLTGGSSNQTDTTAILKLITQQQLGR